MIAFIQESSGNVLGVQAGKELTENDYECRLVPRLESLIARFGRVRVLFLYGRDLSGLGPQGRMTMRNAPARRSRRHGLRKPLDPWNAATRRLASQLGVP
jgi:hypothetical protein